MRLLHAKKPDIQDFTMISPIEELPEQLGTISGMDYCPVSQFLQKK